MDRAKRELSCHRERDAVHTEIEVESEYLESETSDRNSECDG